jgi:hypothetical protein
MRLPSKIKYVLIIIIGILFYLPVSAATLELTLDKNITSPTDDVVVNVTINSEGQNVNTAQATVSFPANLLEATKIDRTSSVFSFWLEEPVYDNGKGTISFVGGSTSGFSGASLKVMQVAFRVKGSGTGRLGITNAAITASDGTGSNVYNTAKGLDINIPATSDFQAVTLEKAKQDAIIAKQLPTQLGLEIPFYPDPSKWNNRSASFQAKWKIGSDITEAAAALNKIANFVPEASAEALTGTKIYPALDDGIWYLHLRLANNIGWSQTLHYRLAIDTMPPDAFKITSDSGFKTGEPKPTISFGSSDLVSGIDKYVISLDGAAVGTTTKNTYTFDPLLPGTHRLVVAAVDKAGNSTSQTETLEILPIASPQITYVSRRVIVNEGGITAGGTALVDGEVVIQVQNAQKQIVAQQTVPVDGNGNWNIAINQALNAGKYHLLATARDKNMASSFSVSSEVINVTPRPMLVLGSLEVTQTWFFIGLLVILTGSFGMGWFTYQKWRSQLGRRSIVAQRDVMNIFDNLDKDIDKLLKSCSDDTITANELTDMKYVLKKMKDSLEKSHRYVADNIREITK